MLRWPWLLLLAACSGAGGLPDASASDGFGNGDSGVDGSATDAAMDAREEDIPDALTLDAGIDTGANAGPRLPAPYPIVFCHGFFGFEDFAGAGFLNYYVGVQEALGEAGELNVFMPTVDPFNDSTHRGEQLLEEVVAILEETGHERVNLVGHSQGGLDARYVAHERPDLVASVTTIATPHEGSRVSDVVLGLVRDERARRLLDAITRVIGAPLFDEVGDETSVITALAQFSTEGAADFNRRYPDQAGVQYFSIAGRSDSHLGGRHCRTEDAPEFVDRWRRYLDPIDPLLAISEEILDGGLLAPEPNDGLVRVSDSKRGRFLGCIPADHLDEIGQLLGDRPGLLNPFDHLEFYTEFVMWLRGEGL